MVGFDVWIGGFRYWESRLIFRVGGGSRGGSRLVYLFGDEGEGIGVDGWVGY